MSKSVRCLLLACMCVSLSMLAGACSKKGAAQGQAAARPVPVLAAQATAQTVSDNLSTFGTAQALATVTVKAEVSGVLTKVHFRKGQDIHRGDVLFTIDPRPYQAALHQAQANLAKNTALLENARRNAQRTEALFARNAATHDELDTAQTTADAMVAVTQADAAAIETAQLQLEHCTISSPIDGKAGDLLIDEGNLIKANDAALVTLNQISPIDVFFSVPQDRLGAIKEQMAKGSLAVHACPPDDPQSMQMGELTFMDNAVDKDSGTIELGATFENAQARLWPGQYLLVSLTLATLPDAVVVPAQAVETGRDGKYVFVIGADKKAVIRPVRPGTRTGDMLVIEQGLDVGEMVVTDGQMRLKPGDTVEIKPAKLVAQTPAPQSRPGKSIPAYVPTSQRAAAVEAQQ